MKLEIKKIGNSSGLILPKEFMEDVNLRQGDWLTVSRDANGNIVLVKRNEEFEKAMEIVSDLMVEYRTTFEALAK